MERKLLNIKLRVNVPLKVIRKRISVTDIYEKVVPFQKWQLADNNARI